MHLVFKFAPESDPQTTLKLKVEVNTREHTSLHGLKSYPFAVDNDWYQAKAEIARGKATLEAVFSYLGRAFLVWRKGQWRRAWGWMELQEIRLDVGARLAAACDVPDLELFPMRYKGVQTVRFSAAREFGVQHLTLWCLAAFRRIGLPFPVARWAASLNRFAGMFDAAAGEKGGMRVSIVGDRSDGGGCMRRTWQLTAPAMDGPEIPCMAAILLARRLARGEVFQSGAFPCMGFLTLLEFAPEFACWRITTRMEEVAV